MRNTPLAVTALAMAACIQPLREPGEASTPQDSAAARHESWANHTHFTYGLRVARTADP